jgi:hypothetical protein
LGKADALGLGRAAGGCAAGAAGVAIARGAIGAAPVVLDAGGGAMATGSYFAARAGGGAFSAGGAGIDSGATDDATVAAGLG